MDFCDFWPSPLPRRRGSARLTFKVAVQPRGPRKHCVISAYIFNEKSRVRLGTK